MKLSKPAITDLNYRINDYYHNKGIDNGYALFSCNKGTLLLTTFFRNYNDVAYCNGENDVPMSGKFEYVFDDNDREELYNNFDEKIKHIIKDEFYFTMKELYAI